MHELYDRGRETLMCPFEVRRENSFSLRAAIQPVGTSNLVDPASSHTLVSKIKPCMSKYKRLYTVKLRTAH